MLGWYFNEDRQLLHGSVEDALAKSAAEMPLEARKSIIREWYDWQAKEGMSNEDLRRFVQDGFGVNLHFEKPIDARNFMNSVHDRLIESIRSETGKQWKP
jgi:hypothetical protein